MSLWYRNNEDKFAQVFSEFSESTAEKTIRIVAGRTRLDRNVFYILHIVVPPGQVDATVVLSKNLYGGLVDSIDEHKKTIHPYVKWGFVLQLNKINDEELTAEVNDQNALSRKHFFTIPVPRSHYYATRKPLEWVKEHILAHVNYRLIEDSGPFLHLLPSKSSSPILKLAIPKGSLQEPTLKILEGAGFRFSISSRSYNAICDDPEIEAKLVRPQEIPKYIERGIFDIGITGHDWIIETGADVVRIVELQYSKSTKMPVRWVVAVAKDSEINTVEDLEGTRIATEAVETIKKFLAECGVKAHVEFSWGATEVKVPELVDAIFDVTETGSSLRANNLRILTLDDSGRDSVIQSYPVLVMNRDSSTSPWKRLKADLLGMLMRGALEAQGKVGLKMNLPEGQLEQVCSTIQGMESPTVSKLREEGWVALEVILDETEVRRIIPALRQSGAKDIIEYPLNKVIP